MSMAKGMTPDPVEASPVLASDSSYGSFMCQRFKAVKLSDFVKSFSLTELREEW